MPFYWSYDAKCSYSIIICSHKTFSEHQGLELNEDICQKLHTKTIALAQLNKIKLLSEKVISYSELVVSLLKCPSTKMIAVNLTSDNIFNQILEEVTGFLEKEPKQINYLRVFVHVLFVSYQLSNSTADEKNHQKWCSYMQSPQIQKKIALAFQIQEPEILQMLLSMIRSNGFPLKELSCFLAKQNVVFTESHEANPPNIFSIPPTTELEHRLDEVLEQVKKLDVKNLNMTQIVEIYRQKIHTISLSKQHSDERLANADASITHLTHNIELMNNQIEMQEKENFALLLKFESTTKQNQVLESEVEHFHQTLDQFDRTYGELKKKHSVALKSLEEKEAKIEQLGKDFETKLAEFREHIKTHEKKLEMNNNELKEKTHKLEEAEREKSYLNESLKKYKDQIIEKDEEIKKYKDELKETEDMREIILKMVSKRQKK